MDPQDNGPSSVSTLEGLRLSIDHSRDEIALCREENSLLLSYYRARQNEYKELATEYSIEGGPVDFSLNFAEIFIPPRTSMENLSPATATLALTAENRMLEVILETLKDQSAIIGSAFSFVDKSYNDLIDKPLADETEPASPTRESMVSRRQTPDNSRTMPPPSSGVTALIEDLLSPVKVKNISRIATPIDRNLPSGNQSLTPQFHRASPRVSNIDSPITGGALSTPSAIHFPGPYSAYIGGREFYPDTPIRRPLFRCPSVPYIPLSPLAPGPSASYRGRSPHIPWPASPVEQVTQLSRCPTVQRIAHTSVDGVGDPDNQVCSDDFEPFSSPLASRSSANGPMNIANH